MKEMKLKPHIQLSEFFTQIKNCEGNVYFVTNTGNHINLKPTISQIFFQVSFISREELTNGYIYCNNQPDYVLIDNFLE